MELLEQYKKLKQLVNNVNDEMKNIAEQNETEACDLKNFIANTIGNEESKYTINENIRKEIESLSISIISSIQQIIIRYDLFLANILIDSKIKIDFLMPYEVGLSIEKLKFIFRFNPLYLFQNNNIKEIIGIILKEIIKIIYGLHAFIEEQGQTKKDKELAEIATEIVGYDNVISDYIIRFANKGKEDSGYYNTSPYAYITSSNYKRINSMVKIPKEGWTSEKLSNLTHKTVEFKSTEVYYFTILKSIELPDENKERQTLDIDVTSPDVGSNNESEEKYEGLSSNKDAYEGLSKDYVQNAYNNIDDATRGTLPSSIQERIKKITQKPELNWKQILKGLIGTIPVPYKNTRTRLNRRQPFRTDLPGRKYKKLVDIVFAMDTSGSVSEESLSKFLNELHGILKVYKTHITVIECDASVKRVYSVKSVKDINYNITGRGGTEFTPVIEYVNSHKEFRNSLLLYFTDGYGESHIPKPLVSKIMWLLYESNYLSVSKPYGIVKTVTYNKASNF